VRVGLGAVVKPDEVGCRPRRMQHARESLYSPPMTLSLSEIRANAIRFASEWKDETSERAEAQTF